MYFLEDAGALDDVMVIEEPETGHPKVEDMPEESKMPEIVEATAGGDPVPDAADENKDDTDKSKEVIDVDSTVTAEGTKLAGRPADRSEPASSSDKPKPEAKKMPLSHHTAKLRLGRLMMPPSSSWSRPRRSWRMPCGWTPVILNGRIPYKNVNSNGRLREISGEMSKYLMHWQLDCPLPT